MLAVSQVSILGMLLLGVTNGEGKAVSSATVDIEGGMMMLGDVLLLNSGLTFPNTLRGPRCATVVMVSLLNNLQTLSEMRA